MRVILYDVCVSSILLTSLALEKVDKTQFQQSPALCVFLVIPLVVLVAETEADDQISLLFCDDFQAYVERPLRLSTGLSSVGSFGTSPCNHRGHLRCWRRLRAVRPFLGESLVGGQSH